MSKRFEFERFDWMASDCEECGGDVRERPDNNGDWVRAQDAIDREAVLQAQIRTLELQLKETRAAHATDKTRLDSRCIVTRDWNEFGELTECERRGIDLRAAIDAAMTAANEREKRNA
jgi:hypothetical protein